MNNMTNLFVPLGLQIRTHCAGFTQYGPDDYNQGNVLKFVLPTASSPSLSKESD